MVKRIMNLPGYKGFTAQKMKSSIKDFFINNTNFL